MTIAMNALAIDSAVHPGLLLPLALMPYGVSMILMYRARAVLAILTLLVVARIELIFGFQEYFDGIFVHRSTMNSGLFISVPLSQLLLVVVGWAVAHEFARPHTS